MQKEKKQFILGQALYIMTKVQPRDGLRTKFLSRNKGCHSLTQLVNYDNILYCPKTKSDSFLNYESPLNLHKLSSLNQLLNPPGLLYFPTQLGSCNIYVCKYGYETRWQSCTGVRSSSLNLCDSLLQLRKWGFIETL